jgi:hypothetical protein
MVSPHLGRDLSIIGSLGLLSYVVDVATAEPVMYQNCKDLGSQASLLLHHMLFVFSSTAWISNNRDILVAELTVIVLLVLHWFTNDFKCFWTQTTNERCGIKQSLRSFNVLFSSSNSQSTKKGIQSRAVQLVFLSFAALVSLYKLRKVKR